MQVLMVVRTDVAHDARVLREAAALAGAGHAVHVLGKDVPDDWAPPAGVTVASTGAASAFRRSGADADRSRPLTPHLRVARWALLPAHRRSVQRAFVAGVRRLASGVPADVVHAHDFTALPVAAELARERGARLVYDAHEWWSGRQRHGRPTPLERRREAREERGLAQAADAVLTVSEGIADRFRRWGCRDVTVVRNSFPEAGPPDGAAAWPAPAPRGLVYAGRVGAARDLETVVAAARLLAPLPVVLAGPPEPAFVGRLDLTGVELRPSTPVDDVDAVLRELGVSVVPLADSCDNHRLALPNKLFHAVRAGVPVVAADLPEIRRLVTAHGIGVLYRPGDAASLAAAVREVVARYSDLRGAVRAARPALAWEHDAAALLGVYARLAASVQGVA